MRIGVDARLLSLPLTGIGRYTLEMLIALQKHPHELFVYSSQPILESVRPRLQDTVTIRVGCAKGRVGRMIWSQTMLPRWANEDKVDVFWGTMPRLPMFLPKRIAKVVTVHDLVWLYSGETMRFTSRLLEKTLMPKAVTASDLIMADSHSTGDAIKTVFPQSAHKVNVVHLGGSEIRKHLDEKRSDDCLEKRVLNVKPSFILFVGTIEPRKNLTRLLSAFAGLPDALRQKHQLVIAGGKGWGNVNLQNTLREFNLAAEVCVVDYVNDEILCELYHRALFLAMPSLYEGFGLPLLEAMSFGKPVLTAETASMPEVAGSAGYYVDPYSVASIQNGLHKLLTDDELYNQLAAQAKTVAEQFSWEKAATEALDVFTKAATMKAQSVAPY